jgi:hypothetical protein
MSCDTKEQYYHPCRWHFYIVYSSLKNKVREQCNIKWKCCYLYGPTLSVVPQYRQHFELCNFHSYDLLTLENILSAFLASEWEIALLKFVPNRNEQVKETPRPFSSPYILLCCTTYIRFVRFLTILLFIHCLSWHIRGKALWLCQQKAL